MGAILNVPMGLQQCEEPSGTGLGRSQARHPIDDLLRAFQREGGSSAHLKGLSNPRPIALKQGVKQRRGTDASFF